MCTNFKHRPAADGTICVGRTMEFPDVIPWEIAVVASDFAGASAAGPNARTWTATHGIVGMSAFGHHEWIVDGINTAGISGHALYMPAHAVYAAPRGDGSDIGALEVLAFVLGTCASVAEVRAALATCNVVEYQPEEVPVPLPLHLIFHDADACVVAEFHAEGMKVTDNPVQVATNAPYLDWHLTNVSNYLSLSPDNPAPVTIGGATFAPLAQGQGMRGIPGDMTAPSRFVRALYLTRTAAVPADVTAARLDTVRILHSFDIVPGTVMEAMPGGPIPEVTKWSTVADLTHGAYVYNSAADPVWYEIDLTATDFSTSRVAPLVTSGGFTSVSV